MTSRARRYGQIMTLRDEGLTNKQIAETLGLSLSTVRNYQWDPTGEKDRARKDSYRRPCPNCGRPMDGSWGNSERAPKFCRHCSGPARRIWTRERIIDAIQVFAAENGRPPLATEWLGIEEARDPRFPYANSVYGERGVFDSWADAIEAAGFPRPRIGHKVRTRSPIGYRRDIRRRKDKRAARSEMTRRYIVVNIKPDQSFDIIGITEANSIDEAIEAVADTEGVYGAVAETSIMRRVVKEKLAVLKEEPQNP